MELQIMVDLSLIWARRIAFKQHYTGYLRRTPCIVAAAMIMMNPLPLPLPPIHHPHVLLMWSELICLFEHEVITDVVYHDHQYIYMINTTVCTFFCWCGRGSPVQVALGMDTK